MLCPGQERKGGKEGMGVCVRGVCPGAVSRGRGKERRKERMVHVLVLFPEGRKERPSTVSWREGRERRKESVCL